MLIDDSHPGLDHALIHRDAHAAAVRVVDNEQVARAVEEIGMLFPHDEVLSTPMGCCHTCVYSANASAQVVAERIAEHLRDVEHRP